MLEARPVAVDEGLFFGAGPFLDLAFAFKGVDSGGEFVGEDELDGAALAGVAGDEALAVGGDSDFKVVGMTGVVGAVGAFEDVDVEGHGVGRGGAWRTATQRNAE